MAPTSRPFFDFWRTRVAFIERLHPGENFYEANVLVWAVLDALAGHWARVLERQHETDRRRLGDFLARHGGGAFGRVSLPTLWALGDNLDPLVAGDEVRNRICRLRGRRTPDVLEERQARAVADDPTVGEVLAELSDILDVVVVRRGRKTSTVSDLVASARFGEIAYTQMRCAIVHEGRLGERAHSFDFGPESASTPTYLSGVLTVPPTMGFSPRFMANVIRSCIDGFESEVLGAGRDPVPPVRGCIELTLDDC